MTDLSLNLTAIEFYNILVQQSAFNTQLIYEPGYAHIVMAPNSGPLVRLPIEVRPSAKNIPPLNLIVIGEDFGKVAETAKKYELPNVDMQLLVGSEFRKFRKVFGFGSSLLDLKFNLPCCYQVKSVFKFKVFIGTAKQAASPDLYEALDISAVVNLSMKEDLGIPSSVNTLTVSIKDEASTNIFKHLEKTTRFINNSFEQNRSLDHSTNVFVFCQMGISRSSTVVLAYLIKEHDMSLKAAFDDLRQSRDIVKPNFGFLKQLQDWERTHTRHRTNLDDLDLL